jgi:glycosyltransferase involved in cell wall biosynthesis
VPLVEAMLMGVPVLAYGAAAVPDTLGGAGVVFREKRYDEIAELAFELGQEGPLRAGVLQAQARRVLDFAPDAVEARLRAHLRSIGVAA